MRRKVNRPAAPAKWHSLDCLPPRDPAALSSLMMDERSRRDVSFQIEPRTGVTGFPRLPHSVSRRRNSNHRRRERQRMPRRKGCRSQVDLAGSFAARRRRSSPNRIAQQTRHTGKARPSSRKTVAVEPSFCSHCTRHPSRTTIASECALKCIEHPHEVRSGCSVILGDYNLKQILTHLFAALRTPLLATDRDAVGL